MKKAPLSFYVYSLLPFVAVGLVLWSAAAKSIPIFLAGVLALAAGTLAIELMPDKITVSLDGIFYEDDSEQ